MSINDLKIDLLKALGVRDAEKVSSAEISLNVSGPIEIRVTRHILEDGDYVKSEISELVTKHEIVTIGLDDDLPN